MIDRVKVSELLIDIDAVTVSVTNPFEYASGVLSPIYTNCRLLSSYPVHRAAIIAALLEKVAPVLGKIDIVAGAGTSALAPAGLLSQRVNLPMIYVRPSEKKHGKQKRIEGVLNPGNRVLLVADIMSTEHDIPNAIEAIRQQGGTVVYCVAIFTNNLGSIEAFLAQEQIPYSALTDLSTLLESASRRGIITGEQRMAIEEWAKDTEGWNQRRQTTVDRTLQANAERIARLLLEINAVTINAEQPFRYASGILSPIYTDNRLLISYPDKWKLIIDAFEYVFTNVIGAGNFDLLAGTATSGIPHAALIADRLDQPLVYVDFERHQGQGIVEGKLTKDKRVVIIEDHVTTGKSVLASISVLKAAGASVPWCVSIFSYLTDNLCNSFTQQGITFQPLCSLQTLLDVAREMKLIREHERESVLQWIADPEHWEQNRQSVG